MDDRLIMGNNETRNILVNGRSLISIHNHEGDITVSGTGWKEIFEYEKGVYGHPLDIFEALSKGITPLPLSDEEREIVRRSFKKAWGNSKKLK